MVCFCVVMVWFIGMLVCVLVMFVSRVESWVLLVVCLFISRNSCWLVVLKCSGVFIVSWLLLFVLNGLVSVIVGLSVVKCVVIFLLVCCVSCIDSSIWVLGDIMLIGLLVIVFSGECRLISSGII